jgi:hypothetical protein
MDHGHRKGFRGLSLSIALTDARVKRSKAPSADKGAPTDASVNLDLLVRAPSA